MVRGIYTAAFGMLAKSLKMDVVTNNLANIDTYGYKGERVAFKSFPQYLIHRINDTYLKTMDGNMDLRPMVGLSTFGTIIEEIRTDFTQGNVIITGNPLDLAIIGDAFFTVKTPFGIRMTRSGNFSLNTKGELVTMDGFNVLGEKGNIVVKEGNLRIDGKGNIFVNDEFVDKLKMVTVEDLSKIRKEGHNLFIFEDGEEKILNAQNYEVKQEALEKANVNPVVCMVNIIDLMRQYEANQRIITITDDTLGKAINTIPARA